MEDGIVMAVIPQYANASLFNLDKAPSFANVISVRLVSPENACIPIETTPFAICMDSKSSQ